MRYDAQYLNASWLCGLLFTLFVSSSGYSQTVQGCGTLSSPGQYGPYDYRNQRDKLPIVESAHFTAVVEALISSTHGGHPGEDIDYTLRAIPNNHRALMSMMRLAEREQTPKPRGSRYTMECWFQRGIAFRPDDGIVRMIYASFLQKSGRVAEAVAQLGIATGYAKDNALSHYNIGLHYFKLKEYDKALVQAHRALALGLPNTELRDQLHSIGKWAEPPDTDVQPAVDATPVQSTQ